MENLKSEYNQNVRAAPVIKTPLSAGKEIAELQSENQRLRQENERLSQELRREHEMHIRCLADFDNYRRRIERERAQSVRAGKREVIKSLLEVVDDFERALLHVNAAPAPLTTGLQAIHRRLIALLTAQGATTFECRGSSFNPTLHEAVATIKDTQAEPGTVLDEVRKGWRFGDELLRPAQVKVAE